MGLQRMGIKIIFLQFHVHIADKCFITTYFFFQLLNLDTKGWCKYAQLCIPHPARDNTRQNPLKIVLTSPIGPTYQHKRDIIYCLHRTAHVKLTFCTSVHWVPRVHQGIQNVSIQRSRSNSLRKCCLGQNHTAFPSIQNVWQARCCPLTHEMDKLASGLTAAPGVCVHLPALIFPLPALMPKRCPSSIQEHGHGGDPEGAARSQIWVQEFGMENVCGYFPSDRCWN